MPLIRTNRKFTKLPDAPLLEFLGGTITGFTNNNQLPNPPVAIAQSGSAATVTKNDQRIAVIDALERNASYVDLTVGGDLQAILASGYEAAGTNRAQSTLEAPQIIAVEHAQSGQLKVRVKGDPHAKSYVGRFKQASGSEFGPSISFKNSKSILFKGLTAGVSYVLQLCAVGGSTGQSDWSETGPNIAL